MTAACDRFADVFGADRGRDLTRDADLYAIALADTGTGRLDAACGWLSRADTLTLHSETAHRLYLSVLDRSAERFYRDAGWMVTLLRNAEAQPVPSEDGYENDGGWVRQQLPAAAAHILGTALAAGLPERRSLLTAAELDAAAQDAWRAAHAGWLHRCHAGKLKGLIGAAAYNELRARYGSARGAVRAFNADAFGALLHRYMGEQPLRRVHQSVGVEQRAWTDARRVVRAWVPELCDAS